MALDIPVPKIVPDVGPGGQIFDVYNRLTEAALKKKKQELENQYYGPEKESEIGQRKAVTEGQNIFNQYAPDKYKLSNEAAQQQNVFNQQMNPYKLEKERILLENLPASEKARIESQKSMANWRNSGGMQMGVPQKELLGLQRQLQIDNPNWDSTLANQAASAYLSGSQTMPDGSPLPKLSGIAQTQIAQIQKRNSTAAIQNQAANMDVLASDLNDIDIAPVAKFSGPNGKIEYAKNAFNMAQGNPVSQDFREYVAFKDVTSQFAMDALRKGFGTSVVPGYVYATLGKASNPNSTWWYDPDQVLLEWNKTKEWINNNASRLKQKSKYGAASELQSGKENAPADPLGIR